MTTFDVALFAFAVSWSAWLAGPALGLARDSARWCVVAFVRLFVVRHTFSHDAVTKGMIEEMAREYEIQRGSPDRYISFSPSFRYIKTIKQNRMIWLINHWSVWKLIEYRGAWILYLPGRPGDVDTGRPPSLVFRRGAVDLRKFLREAEDRFHDAYGNKTVRRFRVVNVYGRRSSAGGSRAEATPGAPSAQPNNLEELITSRPYTWASEEIGVDVEAAETEDLAISPEMDYVFRVCRFWHDRREWHRDRGVPHRLGIGIFGPPGTGKTTAIRAISSEMDLPIYRFHLTGMSGEEFADLWAAARANGPRAVAFEDFDTVFDQRTPAAGVILTFSDVLNVINGIEKDDGVLLFVTANDPSKIDPALGALGDDGRSTRPGRLEVLVKFSGQMDEAGRRKIADRVLRGEAEETIAGVVRAGDGDTPDKFTARCLQTAREVFWAERPR